MLVNIKKRVKLDGKWTFLPVPRSGGRFHPEKVENPGTYYLEWRPDGKAGKRTYEPVGSDPRAALEALLVKEGVLARPLEPAPKPEREQPAAPKGTLLTQACETFLMEIKATKSPATHRTYRVQTRWFLRHTLKSLVEEIDRGDIMALFAKGRDEASDQKTINKRIVVILMMLRSAGSTFELKKGDWPATTDPAPEIYEMDELGRFFAQCDERERVLFHTFLHTGFRHMEVATLRWVEDIDWRKNELKVAVKPEYGFTPKNHEARKVGVPRALMAILHEWKKGSTSALVFPTPPHPKRPKYGGDAIDYHMLETCKEVAHRAGLNCGKCKTSAGKCASGPYCEHYFLHRFRDTYATSMLRSRMDIRTLQVRLGHKSLATTEKYVKALGSEETAKMVETSTIAHLLLA